MTLMRVGRLIREKWQQIMKPLYPEKRPAVTLEEPLPPYSAKEPQVLYAQLVQMLREQILPTLEAIQVDIKALQTAPEQQAGPFCGR